MLRFKFDLDTSRLYHSQQCNHFNGKEKWRNAGLFGLPRHGYIAATERGKLIPACIRNIAQTR